jgi:hypothetical protein
MGQKKDTAACSRAGNSKFNCSETGKRPEKYAGFPAGWKKAGPLPLLFSMEAALAA